MYASSIGKLLEGSSVTGCRVSKYHMNRVNSGTFPDKPPLTIESKTFWIFVQCGWAFSLTVLAAQKLVFAGIAVLQ